MSGQPTITLTVGDGTLRGKLAAIAALSATGFATAKENIGQYMVKRVQERITNQHLWDGSAMPKSKAAAKRGGQTLLDRGNLMASYNYKVQSNGVVIAGGVRGGSGNAVDYAAAMHFGLPARKITAKNGKALFFKGLGIYRKSANIPAIVGRPVLGVNAEDEKVIGKYFLASIEQAGNV